MAVCLIFEVLARKHILKIKQWFHHSQQKEKNENFEGFLKRLFVVLSLGLLSFMQLEADDNCGVFGSDFKISINFSSPFYSNTDKVRYTIFSKTEHTYYIDVTEPGTVTIELTNESSKGDVVFTYSETRCPNADGGGTTQTLTFDKPTDFNLKVYPRSGKIGTSYEYTLEISFLPEASDEAPPYQNQYVCGVFDNVLTTYDHLYANGKHEEVCGTGSIAYPENQITGTIKCDQSYTCNGTPTICERTDPPTNRYSHTFIPSARSGSDNTPSDPTLLKDLNYGNLSYPSNNAGQTIHFDPQTSYKDHSTKVMLLGNLYVNGGYTLAFEPGDYYFDSVTIAGNNNEIILPNGGLVRIFVHNDYEVIMNNLKTNTAPGSAAGDLFIYVEGDVKDLSKGGGTANLKAYFYVKGSVELNNNSNNWQIYGGITAEGPITINGNNPTFIGTQDSGDTGLGECSMCYDLIQVGGFTLNLFNCGGFSLMQDIKVPIWSTDPIHNVTVDEVHKQSLFDFSFFGKNNILDQNNQLIANAIEVVSGWTNGALGMDVSLFGGKAITYPLGNSYGPADAATHYKLHSSSLFSMGFNPCKWMESLEYVAHYDDEEGRHYDVILEPCRTSTPPIPPTYQTGPFDAWDSFRGDTNGDGKFDDKNISTKIAKEPFTLTLVNLDEHLTGTELKGVDSVVTFKLYDDKGQEIPGSSRELNIRDELSLDATFTVPYASRAVTVNFRFCSKFDGTAYTLHDDADCSGETIGCKTIDTTDPRWRACSSSDQFAVRPHKFAIIPPSGEDTQLLTSAAEYPFTVVANDISGANTNEYNQTGDHITLALNNALILANGAYDTEGLLSGTPTLGNDDYYFENGRSHKLNTESTEVVQMSFDDVGKVTFRLVDPEWSSIDLDDTPQNCNGGSFTNAQNITLDIPYGAYICGEQNATFIPASFGVTDIELRNHNNDSNFTYLSNDLNMSAHLSIKISARNTLGNIVQNFRAGNLFYENPVTVDLNVTDWNASLPNRHPLDNSIHTKDIPSPVLLGFGLDDDANGTHTIAWDEGNLTQRVMFNYDRDNNHPVNPFIVPGSDINISVASTYKNSESGATRTVTGSGKGGTDSHVTFYFGRAKASQELCDVEGTVANTPITVQIYCSNSDDFQPIDSNFMDDTRLFCTSFLSDDILTLGQTDQHGWWLSLDHNKTKEDGNVKLKNPPTVALGSGSGSVDTDVTFINGVDSTIQTKHLSGSRPITYDIFLDTTSSTSSWLIYNADSPTLAPNPFYKVRFTGDSGWAGVGKTGHVLDINASTTETKRLKW